MSVCRMYTKNISLRKDIPMSEEKKIYVPPNPTKDYNLRVKGSFLDGGTRPSELAFEIWNGRPRIVAYSNIEGEFRDTHITAGFNHYDWNGFLDQLEAVALGKSDGFMVDNKGFGEGNRELVPQSRIRVGRNERGVITLSVGAGPDKFKADFDLVPDGFHQFMKLDKTPFTEEEASVMMVKNIVGTWKPIMAVLASFNKDDKGNPVMGTVASTAASGGGNSNWSGNRSGNQGGGGYQKKQWDNQGGGGGGYQKKQWNNNKGGGGYNRDGGGGGGNYNRGGYQNDGGGYQKKPWNNNQGGGGYQKKSWNNQGGGNQGGGSGNWDDDVPQ